ncbi:site-specific integrase [Actinophytocola xanthii]|uniref:Site-specific integrase n=1 Tax=Actinophytocola xanthii TaxID=1912961 RepID=A0A1Q8CBW2_9PSEU|nr:site-specific integrase [Actinophytocola xanthii]
MAKRRSRGDGGLYWSEPRQRWIAEVTIGYTPAGKRITRSASGKTKTAAKDKLKEMVRDLDDGLPIAPDNYHVSDAVQAWLTFGLNGRDQATVTNYRCLADTNIVPYIGKRKLRELSADDVDKWLADRAKTLSTRSLRLILSILRRSITFAQARDKVKRNVAMLCECPTGQEGRPSKSLTYDQADSVLTAAEADDSTIGDYTVVSLLGGVRTEEARPLTWPHVHLPDDGERTGDDVELPHVDVFRSVRTGGDTKTRRSRRSLAIPHRAVRALRRQHARQAVQRQRAGTDWQENGLVFASQVGTEMDRHNVLRGFRRILKAAGLNPQDWTPRELRHSFVSLLSDAKVPIEVISRLVGHSGTAVTERVYRHQIRPVVEEAATEMDRIFPDTDTAA